MFFNLQKNPSNFQPIHGSLPVKKSLLLVLPPKRFRQSHEKAHRPFPHSLNKTASIAQMPIHLDCIFHFRFSHQGHRLCQVALKNLATWDKRFMFENWRLPVDSLIWSVHKRERNCKKFPSRILFICLCSCPELNMIMVCCSAFGVEREARFLFCIRFNTLWFLSPPAAPAGFLCSLTNTFARSL